MKVNLTLKKKFILVAILGTVVFSCKKENVQDKFDPCDLSAVTYSEDVSKIIETNCAVSGCHLSPNPAAGKDWSTYQAVFDNKDEIKRRINLPVGDPQHMPKFGELTECEIDKITTWIDNGALNN